MQSDHAGRNTPSTHRDEDGLDARYLAFFDCFNRQLFYEAHDALEPLWLETRHAGDGNFYKGLIQLAAAFVHWQHGRPGPAFALLQRARVLLAGYPDRHCQLEISAALCRVDEWLHAREGNVPNAQTLPTKSLPHLCLTGAGESRR